jgi:hypothetical protein
MFIFFSMVEETQRNRDISRRFSTTLRIFGAPIDGLKMVCVPGDFGLDYRTTV